MAKAAPSDDAPAADPVVDPVVSDAPAQADAPVTIASPTVPDVAATSHVEFAKFCADIEHVATDVEDGVSLLLSEVKAKAASVVDGAHAEFTGWVSKIEFATAKREDAVSGMLAKLKAHAAKLLADV